MSISERSMRCLVYMFIQSLFAVSVYSNTPLFVRSDSDIISIRFPPIFSVGLLSDQCSSLAFLTIDSNQKRQQYLL